MRMLALLRKELADERQNLALFVPTLIVGFVAVLLPVLVAVIIPYVAGERLSDSSDFEVAVEMYRNQPATRGLDPEAAVQAYLFQFFAVMLVLIPVTAAMSIAANLRSVAASVSTTCIDWVAAVLELPVASVAASAGTSTIKLP